MPLIGRLAHTLRSWDERSRLGEADDLDRQLAASAADMPSLVRSHLDPPLDQIIINAWTSGQDIDLSSVGYGPAHWKGGDRFLTKPEPYYHFLAGLVRSQGYKRIFEIGTHYGGSALAMLRGVANKDSAKILTIDVTDLNREIRTIPNVTKFIGDANTERAVKTAVAYFGNEPIDLLFVDADHHFLPTITNLGIYIMLLRPCMIAIDDIMLNSSMKSMWDILRVTQRNDAVNCVDISPQIRSRSCGFGLIRLR
jgi:Methyltransferase domain